MVRVGADCAFGRHVQRRGHDRADLFRLDDGRGRAWTLTPAEDASRRHFVGGFLGMSEKAEVANGVEPGLGHILRARRVAPVVDALDLGVPVTEMPCVGCVEAEQPILFVILPAKTAMQRDVSGNVRVQHDGSPGHGCAIFMSIGRSTLA
jgi:hypothetical protein